MTNTTRSAAVSARQRRAVESFNSAADAIGSVSPGMALFAVTRGQWSMIDAIQHVLDQVGGGACLSLWTWAIADYEIKVLQGLMWRKDIGGASLVVDMSADRRNPAILNEWRSVFGENSVKVCRNHAKIARIWKGDELRLLLRGSMNLNFNARFEQFDLTEGGADYDLVAGIEAELPVLPRHYTFRDVAQATKLQQSFAPDVLAQFGELGDVDDLEVQSI